MATLKGSRDILISSTITSLELVKSLANSEIRKGIDGVIQSLKNETFAEKKKRSTHPY